MDAFHKFVALRSVAAAAVALVALSLFGAATAHATTLSGRVTRAEDGTPVVGARVVTSSTFGPSAEASTDADGRYLFDYSCVGSCSLSATADGFLRPSVGYSSQPPAVTIDFALEREAVIGGRVVLPAGAEPLTNGPEIERYDAATGAWGNVNVFDSGLSGDIYRYEKLPAGTYRLCYEDGVHVRQCFDGQDQGATVGFDYTPVVVASGETNASVNFSPRLGATIEGRIYDGYANVDFGQAGRAYLTIYDENGGRFSDPPTVADFDANGRFRIGGLAAGNYYLIASFEAFLDRVWPNGNCQRDDCDPLVQGMPLTVPPEGATGVDFPLQPYAVVRAKIVDASSGASIANAELSGWLWLLGIGRTTRNWYDASSGEFVSYNTDYGNRIGAVALGYVSRFVVGGNCAVLDDCARTYPLLTQPRGDVMRVQLRLTPSADYLFSNDFE